MEKKKHRMLTSSTILCAEALIKRRQGNAKPIERAKVFTSLVCRGKIRNAMRQRDKGGLLMPDDIDEKSGEQASDVIRSKHPNTRDVKINNVPHCGTCPELINANASEENIETVAKRASGSARPLGVDSVSFSYWIFKFGWASSLLRKPIVEMVEWLANACPPWTTCRALTWCRLIGMKKCPGVRPIGIGEMLRRMLCKVLLLVAGKEATQACGTDHLCGGLEAGIEGTMHHVRNVWDANLNEEDSWGVLLKDKRNAFNEGNI